MLSTILFYDLPSCFCWILYYTMLHHFTLYLSIWVFSIQVFDFFCGIFQLLLALILFSFAFIELNIFKIIHILPLQFVIVIVIVYIIEIMSVGSINVFQRIFLTFFAFSFFWKIFSKSTSVGVLVCSSVYSWFLVFWVYAALL